MGHNYFRMYFNDKGFVLVRDLDTDEIILGMNHHGHNSDHRVIANPMFFESEASAFKFLKSFEDKTNGINDWSSMLNLADALEEDAEMFRKTSFLALEEVK